MSNAQSAMPHGGAIVQYQPRESKMAWRFKPIKKDVFDALCDPRYNLSNLAYLLVLNVYRSQREMRDEGGKTDFGPGVSAYAIAKLVDRDYKNVKVAIASLVARQIIIRDGETLRINPDPDGWMADENFGSKRTEKKPREGVCQTPVSRGARDPYPGSTPPSREGSDKPPGGPGHPLNGGSGDPEVGVQDTPTEASKASPGADFEGPLDLVTRPIRSVNSEKKGDLQEEPEEDSTSGRGAGTPSERSAAVNEAIKALKAGGYQIAGHADLSFRPEIEKQLCRNTTDLPDETYIRKMIIPALETMPKEHRVTYAKWIDQLNFCLSKSRGTGEFVNIWEKKNKPAMAPVSNFDGFQGSRVVKLADLMDN